MATRNAQDYTEREIVVALSGGGHRATIFALGVLLYLVDTGLNKRVGYISSVSGGSIANGFVAQHCDFSKVTVDEFDQIASALLQRIVSGGLYRGMFALPYMILLALSLPLLFCMYNLHWPVPISGTTMLLLIALVAGIGFLRGMVVTLELSRRFFSHNGNRTRLNELSRSVEHVFCSTDLRSTTPVYFSTWNGGYVHFPPKGSCRLSETPFANISLSTVVRASAAFPGGIPPKRLWIGSAFERSIDGWSFGDSGWFVRNTNYWNINDYKPTFFFLADGGVWNNLGTQAIFEHEVLRHFNFDGSANLDWRGTSRNFDVIVANASAPVKAQSLWRLVVPLVGDIGSLFRSINILTAHNVALKIAELRSMNRCVVVDINDSVGDVADRVEMSALKLHPDDGDLRAYMEALKALSKYNDVDTGFYSFADWDVFRISEIDSPRLARECSALPTTLGRISRKHAISLLVHAYQNAQPDLFGKLGYPRPIPRPFVDRFNKLIP
jgi:predicted acylesterase/phospholipase RssA